MSVRRVATNGIELSVREEGEGPLVVLVHGFPELGHSWRHQVPALVRAGYRVAVPDMRGYGASDVPPGPEGYDALTLGRDLTGYLDDVGEESAVFVGHDWGANVVWLLATGQPERVRAVAGLSVPFTPPTASVPTEIFRRRLGEDFYMLWFQEPGVAEAVLEADVRRTLSTTEVWGEDWGRREGEDVSRPRWMTEDDLDVYVRAFERTGFAGGLSYYRNLDRNAELTRDWTDRRVTQPAFFLTGSRDPVALFMPAQAMEGWVTDLRASVVLDGAGHWVQQERPDEVNAALLAWLGEVAPA
jgi:pimeloyl-ACP methyl ester carboxylesterase